MGFKFWWLISHYSNIHYYITTIHFYLLITVWWSPLCSNLELESVQLLWHHHQPPSSIWYDHVRHICTRSFFAKVEVEPKCGQNYSTNFCNCSCDSCHNKFIPQKTEIAINHKRILRLIYDHSRFKKIWIQRTYSFLDVTNVVVICALSFIHLHKKFTNDRRGDWL